MVRGNDSLVNQLIEDNYDVQMFNGGDSSIVEEEAMASWQLN